MVNKWRNDVKISYYSILIYLKGFWRKVMSSQFPQYWSGPYVVDLVLIEVEKELWCSDLLQKVISKSFGFRLSAWFAQRVFCRMKGCNVQLITVMSPCTSLVLKKQMDAALGMWVIWNQAVDLTFHFMHSLADFTF